MKKSILILFLCVATFAANSQVDYSANKSLVVVNNDSVMSVQIADITNRLQSFHKQTRLGQTLTIAGAIVTAASVFVKPSDTNVNYIPYVGGAISLVGGVILFDSYKHFNFKRKEREKKNYTMIEYF